MKLPLKYGMRGHDVEELQQRLNCVTLTRLPLLIPDGNFDVLTMAKVMEFQYLQTKEHRVDGVVGSTTFLGPTKALLDGRPTCRENAHPSGQCILVDLFKKSLHGYQNGLEKIHVTPISGGRPKFPSTRGVFKIDPVRRHVMWRSRQFNNAPMPFSLFYYRGQALHQGDPNLPSHGCIHVPAPSAKNLFNWVGNNEVYLIVVK